MEERETLGEESPLPVYSSTYTERRKKLDSGRCCDRCVIKRVKIDRIFKSNEYICISLNSVCLARQIYFITSNGLGKQVQPTDATFSVARGERERGNSTRQPISTILRCLNGYRAIHSARKKGNHSANE